MTDRLFTADFKAEPYWWEATPRPKLEPAQPPARAEVVIVGSGYTGLVAALQTARAGRHTVVLDAEAAGWGCSSRNGGQIGSGIDVSFATLTRRHGRDTAFAIFEESHRSLTWIGDFIAAEDIACDFKRVGRFHAAHNAVEYDRLAKEISSPVKGLEDDAHMVSKAEQGQELASPVYHGGAVYPQHAALDPARYHQGLLERVLAAEAEVIPHCAVTGLARQGDGFRVTTAKGEIAAREVIVATNGYPAAATPWLRRRVIPIGSYMIATEPLAAGLVDRLMPRDRVITDTRKLVFYYRASPDRQRILFGGRVSVGETDPRLTAPALQAELSRIFPELAEVRVSHSWVGFVAYTFDELPHLGRHDGLYYAMGYCGSGIAKASYFGQRIAQQLLGLPEGQSAFDRLPFRTRPFYSGKPWFLPPMVRYYAWRDRQGW
jgi:glycine/D-amino acid oxidase-like deaminating enzyme